MRCGIDEHRSIRYAAWNLWYDAWLSSDREALRIAWLRSGSNAMFEMFIVYQAALYFFFWQPDAVFIPIDIMFLQSQKKYKAFYAQLLSH